MKNLLIHEDLNQALHEEFSMHINGTKYDVEPHFSVSGKETVLEQFARLLCKREINMERVSGISY